jgi:hypothetical protein
MRLYNRAPVNCGKGRHRPGGFRGETGKGHNMQPEKFSAGYYRIIGIPDNRTFEDWYIDESDNRNNDLFLWNEEQYETPLHQARQRAHMATRRETKLDAIVTLSIAPEAGPILYDWRVDIDTEKKGILISGNCEFAGFHPVKFVGPPEMHTYQYRRATESTDLYKRLYALAEQLCDSGDTRFRRSRRSGLVMYAGCWPRYHSNGQWWEGAHENSYLSFDNDDELLEQWEFIFARDEWLKKREQSKTSI